MREERHQLFASEAALIGHAASIMAIEGAMRCFTEYCFVA